MIYTIKYIQRFVVLCFLIAYHQFLLDSHDLFTNTYPMIAPMTTKWPQRMGVELTHRKPQQKSTMCRHIHIFFRCILYIDKHAVEFRPDVCHCPVMTSHKTHLCWYRGYAWLNYHHFTEGGNQSMSGNLQIMPRLTLSQRQLGSLGRV